MTSATDEMEGMGSGRNVVDEVQRLMTSHAEANSELVSDLSAAESSHSSRRAKAESLLRAAMTAQGTAKQWLRLVGVNEKSPAPDDEAGRSAESDQPLLELERWSDTAVRVGEDIAISAAEDAALVLCDQALQATELAACWSQAEQERRSRTFVNDIDRRFEQRHEMAERKDRLAAAVRFALSTLRDGFDATGPPFVKAGSQLNYLRANRSGVAWGTAMGALVLVTMILFWVALGAIEVSTVSVSLLAASISAVLTASAWHSARLADTKGQRDRWHDAIETLEWLSEDAVALVDEVHNTWSDLRQALTAEAEELARIAREYGVSDGRNLILSSERRGGAAHGSGASNPRDGDLVECHKCGSPVAPRSVGPEMVVGRCEVCRTTWSIPIGQATWIRR